MDMEVTKVSNVMTELFRRCRKRQEQSVRDFNVEFERLLLYLKELDCELPALVKAWLYLDKLRLSEGEELALLSSVHNKYDVKLLQQAAILHDRGGGRKPWEKGGSRWNSGSGGAKQVHMTAHEDYATDDEDLRGEDDQSESELVPEAVAEGFHSAFMAFQDAKSKYREALRGRGVDQAELKKRAEDRLKAAKLKSYCAACKRKGHWHKDPECPLRGRTTSLQSSTASDDNKTKHVQECHHVNVCFMAQGMSCQRSPTERAPSRRTSVRRRLCWLSLTQLVQRQ
jgi:hypothetical protein